MENNELAIGLAALLLPLLFILPIMIFMIVANWKLLTKAGQPGWSQFIPIYNIYIMLKICNRPVWWLLLMLIPGVNIVIAVLLCLDLATAFGQTPAFGILILFLSIVAIPVLAFGSAKYVPIVRT